MTAIWRCPTCQRPTEVSEDLDPTTAIRCPHCDASGCLPDPPPCNEPAQDELPHEETASEAPLSPGIPGAWELVVRCPHCQAEAALRELTVAATGVPLDAAMLSEVLESSHEPFAAVGGTDEEHDGAFTFETAVLSGSVRPPATWTQQSSSKGMLGRAFGILLGGLLAIPLAYYILNAVGGQAFDLFPVPLPGVQHTYHHIPSWWPDGARPGSAPHDADHAGETL